MNMHASASAGMNPDEAESARLAALRELAILDTLPEREYDDLVHLASVVCGTSIALVSLVDQDRQWFKAQVGIDAKQTPLDVSFCVHAIAQPDARAIFEVPDATADARFMHNGLVTGDAHLRFYAGVPLVLGNGLPMGTLCVLDQEPRKLTPDQQRALQTLARSVVDQLELRRQNLSLRREVESLSAGRLWAILESTADGIYGIDASGRCSFVNRAAADMLGYTRKELLGRTMHDLVHHWPAATLHRPAECVVAPGRSGTFRSDTERVFRKDGSSFAVALACSTITDGKSAEPIGAVVLFTDITARKAVEAAAAQATREAQAARSAAEAASRAKGEFLANMSHELRTPLNGVIGMADLLASTTLTPEQARLTHVLKTSADSLLNVINQVLDFSKIEAGKLELEAVGYSVREVVDAALEIMGHRASSKGLALMASVAPDVPAVVRGDPGRLRQILINLVNNAVKFTEQGQVDVRVSWTGDATGDAGELRFDVVDTGPGIAADRIGKLFKSFSQADASTTRRHGGTGLGLVISARLAALMGGQSGVDSTVGVGSTFWFTARVSLAPHAPPVDDGTTGQHQSEPQSLTGLRVLVAEDNEVNQEVISFMLNRLGCRPVIVGDGRAAVDAVVAEPDRFDAVLMDCQMPTLDGFQATVEIRRQNVEARRARPLPILALTASAVVGDRDRCLSAGMDGYLTKPIQRSELAAALQALLRGCRTLAA